MNQRTINHEIRKFYILLTILLSIGSSQTPLSAQSDLQIEVNSYLKNLPFEMPGIHLPVFPDRNFDIVEFGAVGDGHTLNTDAFKKAIEACSSAGGGKVIVPPGLWLTGPIELKSFVNLHLAAGALVVFTPDHSAYPILKAPRRGLLVASPIYGFDLENVAITGEGIFDGSGDTWRPVKKFKTTESQWKRLLKSSGVVDYAGKIWWPSKEAADGEQYLKNLKSTKKKKDITTDDYLPATVLMSAPAKTY